jgi:hypothetical protein
VFSSCVFNKKKSVLKVLDRTVYSKNLKLCIQIKTNAPSVHFYVQVKDGLRLTKLLIKIKLHK